MQNRDASICLGGGLAALTATDGGVVQAYADEQHNAHGSHDPSCTCLVCQRVEEPLGLGGDLGFGVARQDFWQGCLVSP